MFFVTVNHSLALTKIFYNMNSLFLTSIKNARDTKSQAFILYFFTIDLEDDLRKFFGPILTFHKLEGIPSSLR